MVTVNLRPNKQRARNAIMLIWIVMGLEVVLLISGYLQYELLNQWSNGGEISIESADANDSREQILGIVYMIAYILSSVMFIQWFRRAYYNLHQKINHLSYSEGWAAGAWFVPILNLFRPYQIMKELYNETKNLLLKNGLNISKSFSTNLVGLWWALWIIGSFLGQAVFRLSMNAETIDELTTMTMVSMASNVFGIPLGLIAIKVIQDYSNIEPLLNEINNQEEEEVETPEKEEGQDEYKLEVNIALVKCNHCNKETLNTTGKCRWCNKELEKNQEILGNKIEKPTFQ